MTRTTSAGPGGNRLGTSMLIRPSGLITVCRCRVSIRPLLNEHCRRLMTFYPTRVVPAAPRWPVRHPAVLLWLHGERRGRQTLQAEPSESSGASWPALSWLHSLAASGDRKGRGAHPAG